MWHSRQKKTKEIDLEYQNRNCHSGELQGQGAHLPFKFNVFTCHSSQPPCDFTNCPPAGRLRGLGARGVNSMLIHISACRILSGDRPRQWKRIGKWCCMSFDYIGDLIITTHNITTLGTVAAVTFPHLNSIGGGDLRLQSWWSKRVWATLLHYLYIYFWRHNSKRSQIKHKIMQVM